MAFRNGAWAKVWTVEHHDKFTKIRFSTSVKDKATGEYVTDFNGFASLVGTAHAKASGMKDGDRIRIGDCAVTNRYDKTANKEFVNFAIFSYDTDAEASSGQGQRAASHQTARNSRTVSVSSNPVESNDEDDDLPF